MASNAKKGKKKKWVPLDLALGDETTKVVKTTNWGDEMEMQDEDDSASRVVINLSALPTAPRSARGADVDLSRVPTVKPFTAFIGNLPFEVSQEDIRKMFKDVKVEGVRLQTDQSGRMRGYGYVEFETREMLIEALSYNDASIRGRTVRVDLADNQHGQDRDRQDGGGFRSRDDGDDKTLGDWRKKEDRGSDKFSDRDRKDDFERGSDRMDRDRYERRDRFSSERHDDRGGEQKRGWGGAGSRSEGERFGHFGDRADRGHFDDRDKDRDFGGKSFGSGYRSRENRDRDHEGDRFGSRDFRGNDRFRDGERPRDGENWGRSSDRFDRDSDRREGRSWNGDRHRDSDRADRPRDTDRGDRFRDKGDRYHDTADRGERYRNEERGDRHHDEERGDDKAGDRFRYDRERGHDEDRPRERQTDEVRNRKREEDDEKDRGRDHSHEVERDTRSRDASKEIEKAGPKGRPKLNLQPRTKPLEEAGKMAAASASIFGGAKPVDTTQKLREIEEKQSKLRQKPEKDHRAGSEDDRPAVVSRQASSSDGPLPEDAPTYKRQNSASKPRPKKDASQDSEKRKDRPTTASGSSGRASNGSRKSSHTDVDDVSSVEADATVEKPAPVKMIPAPPPKENAWEKRKTIAAQQQTPVVGANAPAETVKQPEVVDPKEEIPKEETVAAKVEVIPPSPASDSPPTCAETLNPQSTSEEKLETVADAPAVNVWEMRKKQNEAKSQKPEKPAAEASVPSQEVEVRKKAVVSIAGVGEAGGRGGGLVDRSDRRPGPVGRGEGGRGGARGGMRRTEGGDIKRSEDKDSKRALPKKEKEKALPTSIEEMPKLEDKSKKDWSDRNKFSSLLMAEEEDDDDNKKGSDDEDNN